ncbi:MAG: TldD protein [Kiritimatiellia bacterium]
MDDDPGILRHIIWSSTEQAVQTAQKNITRVRANQAVKVAEGRVSADFSIEAPVVYLGPIATLNADLAAWKPVLTKLSTVLADEPLIIHHAFTINAEASTEWIVTSEGTRIRQPRHRLRVSVTGSVTADDGMDLRLYRWRDVVRSDQLPAEDELESWVRGLRTDVLALRRSPRGAPWSGPALLRGRAAGVFVHEVIGHRVEGQTFRDLVGRRVTNPHISIVDDPSLGTYAGHDLNGHYAYVQQGVPARKATVIEDGVLRGFLFSRDPIEGFNQSNGHGRAATRLDPVARMANTIVTTDDPRTQA